LPVWYSTDTPDRKRETDKKTDKKDEQANGQCTLTDGIVVEVWFAFVACESLKCIATVTLTCLFITRHAIGSRVVTVTRCTDDRQTDHAALHKV